MSELKKLFEGVSGLPDDFAEKVDCVFEAAVAVKAEEITSKALLEQADVLNAHKEQVTESLTEAADKYIVECLDKVDEYLEEAVHEWMAENAVALDGELKANVAVQYMKGLKSLVSESASLVGDSDALAESYQRTIDKLSNKVSVLSKDLAEATEVIKDLSKKSVFAEATSGLSMTSKDRVAKLAESIDAESIAQYRDKLSYILEAVGSKKESDTKDKEDSEVDVEGDDEVSDDENVVENQFSESFKRDLDAIRAVSAWL